MRRLVREIVPGIYKTGGLWGNGILGANIYLIADNGITLVDTGSKGRLRDVVGSLRSLGYSLADVERIIITHHHPDHTGNLAKLKELTGATVIAHMGDAPYIDGSMPQLGLQRPVWLRRYLASFNWSWIFTPVKVDMPVSGGEELPLLGGVQIVHTPGHTPGSICLWFKYKKLLIVGDLLAHRFGLRLPALMFTVDIDQEIRSVQNIVELDFEIICFGHGSPILENARESVARFAARTAERYLR